MKLLLTVHNIKRVNVSAYQRINAKTRNKFKRIVNACSRNEEEE